MWVASLSNGETVIEQPPVAGEISTWQELLARLKVENLKITQMRVQAGKRTVVAMPKVDGYVQCYEQRGYVTSSGEVVPKDVVQGIGSVIGDQVFITWVNQQGDAWQDMRPLAQMKIHSTLA